MDDIRTRVDQTVETLTAGLERLSDPQQRLTYTELVLNEFLPTERTP